MSTHRLLAAASRLARLAFPLLLGALLLFWFSRAVALQQLGDALKKIPVTTVLAVALANIAATVCQGLRFSLLFPGGLSRWRHIGLCFALSAGNILLPFRGGEVIRPLYIRRWSPSTSLRSLVTCTIVDRLLEALCLLPYFLLAVALLWTDPRFHFLRGWVSPLCALALLLVGLFVVVRLWRLSGQLQSAGEGRLSVRLGLAVALALFGWAMNYGIFYAAVPRARLALSLLLAVNLALGLPSLPAGVGPYEAAFLWVGQLAGLPRETVVAAALVSHFVQILSSLLVGLPLLAVWGWPKRADEVARGVTVDE